MLTELDISDGNQQQLQAIVNGNYDHLNVLTIRDLPSASPINELHDMTREIPTLRSLSLELNVDSVISSAQPLNPYPLHLLSLSGSNQFSLMNILGTCSNNLMELAIK